MNFSRAAAVRLASLVLIGGLCSTVQAHFPWIEALPGADDARHVEVRFGHGPSDAAALAADRLATLTVVNSGGDPTPVALDQAAQTRFAVPADAALVGATQAPGFWSRKAAGGERLPRNQVPDALGCTYSRNGVKTIIDLSDSAALTQPLDHALEIVPARAPKAIDGTWQMPVKVTFADGAYTGRLSLISLTGDDKPVLFDANAEGAFEVHFPRAGRWMLYARTTTPYPDLAVCDENGYNATLVLDLPKP